MAKQMRIVPFIFNELDFEPLLSFLPLTLERAMERKQTFITVDRKKEGRKSRKNISLFPFLVCENVCVFNRRQKNPEDSVVIAIRIVIE
jgi:hypothetical protein